jgi:uncharacterized membrane protein YphA (DoxX/SURF4 family)
MASKPRTIALWSLAVLLALLFLMSGLGKLSNSKTAGGVTFDEQFVLWGLPAWFRFPVGLAEVAGAIGLLVPRLRFYAATGLTLLMAGAIVTHLRIAEYGPALVPLTLAILAGVVAWLARPTWVVKRMGSGRTQVA